MPRRDATGPLGQGAMTGRALGNCNPQNAQVVGFGAGRGRGFARGLGRGAGRGFNNFNYTNTTSYTAPSLEEEKEYLNSRLEEINKQLNK